MRYTKLFSAAALALLVLAVPALAQTNAVQRNEAAAGPNAGANAPLPVMPMGIIYGTNASVAGTTGTGEQTLGTFAMPAGTLDVVGRRLKITASFSHAANSNAITPKLYFGSEALATAADSTTGSAAMIQCYVLKTAASTQNVDCWGLGGAAGVVPVTYSAPGSTETDTAAITIKATCTGGTSGADCTLTNFAVEELN